MTSTFSWENCQPLPCFNLYSIAKFACYSRYFLTSYFCIPVLYNEKDIFFGCQFQKFLQFFIDPFSFSFFSITGLGIDLDYCDIEWFASETSRDHSVLFEIASNRYMTTGKIITSSRRVLIFYYNQDYSLRIYFFLLNGSNFTTREILKYLSLNIDQLLFWGYFSCK